MPTFSDLLISHPQDIRNTVLSYWGFEGKIFQIKHEIIDFCEKILSKKAIEEAFLSLPLECQKALKALGKENGRLIWEEFTRRYGEIRIFGENRRELERPDLNPISCSETLFYRGFIGRAFFGVKPEPKEFAYIPDEIQKLLFPFNHSSSTVIGQEMVDISPFDIYLANDKIIDHVCTYLSCLRMGMDPNILQNIYPEFPLDFIKIILTCGGLIGENGELDINGIKIHLEMNRNQALLSLIKHWLHCDLINEFFFIPGLEFEGEINLNPMKGRSFLFEVFKSIPKNQWWDLNKVIIDIKKISSDFIRTSGEFDTWFIRDSNNCEYLRGFENWEKVEGNFIRFFFGKILHWLGLVDIAKGKKGEKILAIRCSKIAQEYLQNEKITSLPEEKKKFFVNNNGVISAHRLVPRSIRYQVARFCEWLPIKKEEYQYRVTYHSLKNALEKSLKPAQLKHILNNHAQKPTPPNIYEAINKWNAKKPSIEVKKGVLLKVVDKTIIDELKKKHPKNIIVEVLNDNTALIREDNKEQLHTFLTKLGYLAKFDQTI